MKTAGGHLWVGIFLGLLAHSSVAETNTGLFSVSITLNNPGSTSPLGFSVPADVRTPGSDVCISEALSQQAHALVRVVCGTGQFVSIDPWPGKPFLGTHGGAFRYRMGASQFPVTKTEADHHPGNAAATAMHIYNADGPLEVLVRF